MAKAKDTTEPKDESPAITVKMKKTVSGSYGYFAQGSTQTVPRELGESFLIEGVAEEA
jgi:hypothetical protein